MDFKLNFEPFRTFYTLEAKISFFKILNATKYVKNVSDEHFKMHFIVE